jgi:hypothetical protein
MPEERTPYDNQLQPLDNDAATVRANLAHQFEMPQRERFADAMKWAPVTGDEQSIRNLIHAAANGQLT